MFYLSRMKLILSTTLLALVISTFPNITSAAEKTIRLMISPSGSGPYNAFATIQTHMADFSEFLRLSTEETPGFNFNVKYLATHPE
jgi:uncharacterized protein